MELVRALKSDSSPRIISTMLKILLFFLLSNFFYVSGSENVNVSRLGNASKPKFRNASSDFSSNDTLDDDYASNCTNDYCLTNEDYIDMIIDHIYPTTFEWVLIAMHSVTFIVGLVGNALVCIAVYKNRGMRNVTNYFIVNLAVADFMVILFCLPPTVVWDITETWFMGTLLCKIVLYFQTVSVAVSVLTLTFISVDRWYAICFPLKFKSTTTRAKISIIIIWFTSLTIALNNRRTPMGNTTESQLRSRRKAAKMLVAVVIMFALCYFPVHLLNILRNLINLYQTDFTAALSNLTHWLCYANSAINPIIYNFMSGKFRREFKRAFQQCHHCGKKKRQPDIDLVSQNDYAHSSNRRTSQSYAFSSRRTKTTSFITHTT